MFALWISRASEKSTMPTHSNHHWITAFVADDACRDGVTGCNVLATLRGQGRVSLFPQFKKRGDVDFQTLQIAKLFAQEELSFLA
jgi:hypothetical protein